MYYRAVSSAGAYEMVSTGSGARSLTLENLAPDTAYELKVQAYNAQAPSEFSAILVKGLCFVYDLSISKQKEMANRRTEQNLMVKNLYKFFHQRR